MCLVLFAWKAHPDYPLVLAANREEFHDRPASGAHWWTDPAGLLAGQDLLAGGTWMGVMRSGRVAALTNYREPGSLGPSGKRSRGALVTDALQSGQSPLAFTRELASQGDQYSGFNLLLGDVNQLAWVSNRAENAEAVPVGVHGLSNHLLDTDWPKVHHGRERLAALLNGADDREQLVRGLFDLVLDRRSADGEIPETVKDDFAPERLNRHYFILSPEYGTRCSTVVLLDKEGGVYFEERRFSPDGEETGRSREEFVTGECNE